MNTHRDEHLDALCNKIDGLEIALRTRTEQLKKAKAEIAELKRQAADNADALLAAYQQGRADGKDEACNTK